MPGIPGSRSFDRMVVVVCDSVGCGGAPDAVDFNDEGANTLAAVIEGAQPKLENLRALGLFRVPGVPGGDDDVATGAWGRMVEQSAAKDTLTGHWELMGIVSSEAPAVYPDGFPSAVIAAFESAIGRSVLGNYAASGTEIIRELGAEHMQTGAPIVYTSGDSVFQIAAHEEVVGVESLYDMCLTARRQLQGQHRVTRVIARPFVGCGPEDFRRTFRRRDFALPPPGPTALDRLQDAGFRTHGVGKIHDIFAGRGLTSYAKTQDNRDGVAKTCAALREDQAELVFTNLVDFDSQYGHRRDVRGYARCLEEFDAALPDLLEALGPRDCLVLTADHGNDPSFRGTDHTRECVPLLVSSTSTTPSDLGTRESFTDLGQTILDNFGIDAATGGRSFLPLVS